MTFAAAGYHVTNDNKTDYNYATADIPNGEQLTYKEWQAIDGNSGMKEPIQTASPANPFSKYITYPNHTKVGCTVLRIILHTALRTIGGTFLKMSSSPLIILIPLKFEKIGHYIMIAFHKWIPR